MEILFNDNDIVVCIKPCGVLSQADLSGKSNMIDILKEEFKTDIFPIHRLDREVGGVMVYAKNKTAAATLSSQIQNSELKKEYIAMIHSKPCENNGEMIDYLFKDSSKNKSFVVKKERKGVKKAILNYELIKSFKIDSKEYSIVKIRLVTGRTHQIRVQFSSRKMPLVGDRKYGGKDEFKTIGLWSYGLTFLHPTKKELMYFNSEPQNFICL